MAAAASSKVWHGTLAGPLLVAVRRADSRARAAARQVSEKMPGCPSNLAAIHGGHQGRALAARQAWRACVQMFARKRSLLVGAWGSCDRRPSRRCVR